MALLLVVLGTTFNSALAENYISLSKTMVDGKFYDYRISEDNLSKTPSWNPVDEPAPLAPHKAVSVAREYLKSHSDISDYGLNQISIVRVVSKKHKNKWYYTLMISKRGDIPGGTNVFVMMDGSVIEPVQVQDLGTVCPEEE